MPSDCRGVMWTCEVCGFGPHCIEVFPVRHQCTKTETLDCTHRGPAIATHTCQLCGNRGKEIEVYECSLHGKCVLRRWSDRNQERDEGERICLICADRA